MDVPDWADTQLTNDIPRLLRGGEGQSVEFKEQLPKQASDLAYEVAAFASSNTGLILLGVADSGEVVGVGGVDTNTARDAFVRRILGICQVVRPSVTPTIAWAVAESCSILCITVPKGVHPLYYVHHRPYVRRASVSRPAEPDEVVNAIKTSDAGNAQELSADSNDSAYFAGLAQILVGTLIWCDVDVYLRSLNPWVGEWTSYAQHAADKLRDIAADDFAIQRNMQEAVQGLASLLDSIANFVHVIGGANDFEKVCADVRESAQALFDLFVRPIAVSKASELAMKSTLQKTTRLLTESWKRAEKDPYSQAVAEAQVLSGQYGRRFMEISYYPLEFLTAKNALILREIGAGLFLLEAKHLYLDGGESQRQAIAAARGYIDQVTQLQQSMIDG